MHWRILLVATWFAIPLNLFAIPGDQLYYEDFESGAGGWSQVTGPSGSFGINTAFGDNDAFVAGDSEVRAVSPTIDLSGISGARVSLTVIRGKQLTQGGVVVSNKPEADENFYLEFVDADGNWLAILTEYGGGSAGEAFNEVIDLPASALHAGFRLRASTVGGDPWDGEPDDFWHFDNIEIIETGSAAGDLSNCAFGDDFESGTGNWAITGNATTAGTTYNSASNSLDMVGQSLVTMNADLDLAGKTATLTAWVRAGNWPGGPDGPAGNGEMLEFEYRRSNGSWWPLYDICQCSGSGDLQVDDGGVALVNVALPATALHSTFRLRIRNPSDAVTADHWFVDDLCIAATSSIDHFAVEHDGSAVNCQPEFVNIVAHAADHTVATNYAGTIALSTSTNRGDWSAAVAVGTLTNLGNGAANYAFNSADNGNVTLRLSNTYIETVNINVIDTPMSEDSTEDADLAFAASGFQFVSAGSSLPVASQIAGKPSDQSPAYAIELQAIRTDTATGACEAAFVGNTAVELAMTCETPGVCAAASGIVNGNSIATGNAGSPGSWTSMNVDFGDNTDDTAPIVFRYDDAGGVKLHARKTLSPSGELMTGSSNEFVVRPFGFSVVLDEGSINNINPAASGPAGSGFERAGEPFRATVRAVGWQAADDANADGIPDGHDDADPSNNANLADNFSLPNFAKESTPDTVTLDRTLVAPTGGSNPALTGTLVLGGFSSGGTSSNNLRWQEVGVIEISASLGDNDYLGAGAIHGRSGYVGRFVPHHFTTVVDDHGCSNAAAFTWSKQPLRKLTITALAADNSTAENFGYNGGSGFATDITLSDPSSPSPGSFNSTVSSAAFVTGVAELNDTVSFGFSAVETAPYSLAIRATDADGGSSETFAEGQTEIRSGRLLLGFAAAPVMVDARSEIDTHRWTGAAWQLETDDSCTGLAIATSDFSYSDFQINLADGESAASNIGFYGGEGLVRFSNPGVGNDGSMRATLDVPEWLEFDWTGDSVPDDPFNTILFVPKHAREAGLIDLQEVVR